MTREGPNLEEYIAPCPVPFMEEEIKPDRKYYCQEKGCTHEYGYKKPSSLNRHRRCHHNPLALWRCGCCQNQGIDGYKSPRKDHVVQHLAQVHYMKIVHECMADDSSGCNRLLFSGQSCLEKHMRQEHGSLGGVLPRSTIAGQIQFQINLSLLS